MGVDPGFGSSAFGIVVTRIVNGKIQVVYADEHERPDYNKMLDKIFGLVRGYDIDYIYVDGSNPEIISNLKRGLGERSKPSSYIIVQLVFKDVVVLFCYTHFLWIFNHLINQAVNSNKD